MDALEPPSALSAALRTLPCRQFDREGTPLALPGADHIDLAAHQLEVALDDRQAQPGVGRVGLPRRVSPVEALEDVGPRLRRDADAGVAHLEPDVAVDALGA